MTMPTDFAAAFERCPLVAILRGVRPYEVEGIGMALSEAGFCLIEVPLNSPDPLHSIERLAMRLDGLAVIGAGTVLTPGQVRDAEQAGGRFMVSPNTNYAVISETEKAGMTSLPGCFTATEALAAIDSGAHALKFFPAEAMNPPILKALAAVLPPKIPKLAVGGITAENMAPWLKAGAHGFGLGSALYSPGASPETTSLKAQAFIRAWCDLQGT